MTGAGAWLNRAGGAGAISGLITGGQDGPGILQYCVLN